MTSMADGMSALLVAGHTGHGVHSTVTDAQDTVCTHT